MKEHGDFAVRRLGRIVEVILADSFNLEGATALMEAITRESDDIVGETWALLYDARDFSLATPEVMMPWVAFAHRMDHRHRTHVAVVADEGLLEGIVSEYVDGVSAQVRFFSNRTEALGWLEGEGFE